MPLTLPGGADFEIGVAFGKTGFEAVVDGDYTDLSAYNLLASYDRGRSPYSSKYDVGVFRCTFVNIDRRFDQDNASGPYYGRLGPDHPFRIRGDSECQMSGFTGDWRATEMSSQGQSYSVCELVAYETSWVLNRTRMEGVGYRELVLSHSPDTYYRLGDRDGRAQAYDETGNGHDGFYGNRPRKPASGLLTADSDTAADLTDDPGGSGVGILWSSTPGGWHGTGAFAAAFVFQPTDITGGMSVVAAIGSDAISVTMNSSGQLRVETGFANSSYTTAAGNNDDRVVVVRRNAGATTVTLEVAVRSLYEFNRQVDTVTAAWVGSASFASPIRVLGEVVVDEFAIWSTTDPGSSLITELADKAFLPGEGDTGDERFADLAGLVGTPPGYISNPAALSPYIHSSRFGAYKAVPGSSVFAALQTLAASETAEVFVSRSGALTRVPYTNPEEATPVVEFDDVPASANAKSDSRTPVRGSEDRRTRQIVSDGEEVAIWIDPVTAGAEADDTETIFPGYYVDLVGDIAQRRSRHRRNPGQRLDPLTVKLSGLNSVQRADVLSLDLSDVIASTLAGVTTKGKVVRIRGVVTPDEWTVEYSTEALPPTGHLPTARAFEVATSTGSLTTASRPALRAERWDTDQMHASALASAPDESVFNSIDSNRLFTHSGLVHLVHANILWERDPTGHREVAIANDDNTVGLARVVEPGYGVMISNIAGNAQIVGTLMQSVAGMTEDPLSLWVRSTNSATDLQVPSTSGPDYRYAPALSIAAIPANLHSVRVKRTTSQSITSGPGDMVLFTNEDFDPAGMHSTSSNTERITAQRDGVYLVGCNLAWKANSGGARQVWIQTASAVLAQKRVPPTGSSEQTCMEVLTLSKVTAGTWFRVGLLQTSGSTLTLDVVSASAPVFWATEIPGPSVRVTNSVAYDGAGGHPSKVATSTERLLGFDTERWDDDGMHSTSSNTGRITATRDGLWVIWAAVAWESNASGSRSLWLVLNGSEIIAKNTAAPPSSSGESNSECWVMWELKAGDYVEAYVWQDSGSSLTLAKHDDWSPEFAMAFVG